eukprot:CAMPEP_0172302628 /NCGR_PEP_ID=MMETSP1058-20130122/4293_1 /TAXON_ID=83371 /ORGANISM="Detonula confervacea, Strain CCMP 353" /LENGTH=243 /DNA_ID=CAMNT_0013013165 /DNA_START=172 /DNA_END=900 /DNA_ORIENTATION=-
MPSSETKNAASEKIHYDVLQISHTASPAEIKAAYRSLVIGYHPDKAPSILNNYKDENHTCKEVKISDGLSFIDIDDDDDVSNESANADKTETENNTSITSEMSQPTVPNTEGEETATQNTITFHQIQAAYVILRDPNKRHQYDESIRRKKEREEWKWKGAIEVNLSEMDCDFCCVVDEDNSENDDEEDNIGAPDEDEPLQKVFFHPCRCGDTFQVVQEELLESIMGKKCVPIDKNGMFTNRVW